MRNMTPGRGVFSSRLKALFLLLRAFSGADILYMLGAAAITAGFWEWSKALGLIVLGVFFCAFGLLLTLRR